MYPALCAGSKHMYDLHTHSLLSDGVLLPSEIAARYAALGYKAIAICDHADYSNIEFVTDAILKFTKHWPKKAKIKVLPGIELTHLPLEQFKPLAKYARKRGIKIIVAHGESPVEPVAKGTNRAAIEAGIDILAHPGRITDEDVNLAKRKGVFLEITARRGHAKTNAYLVSRTLKAGAKLIINTDSHCPQDIIPPPRLLAVARRAGLSQPHINKMVKEVKKHLTNKRICDKKDTK
jgi:histidinol phosphatase-like PHP family hydrolase